MTDLDELRAALHGEPDPLGSTLDLPAVRQRAHRLRRTRRLAVSGTAALAVVAAVAVPYGLTRTDTPAAPVAAADLPAGAGCPATFTPAGAADQAGLPVPFAAEQALACGYLPVDRPGTVRPLVGALTLDTADTRELVDRVNTAGRTAPIACTRVAQPSFSLLLLGPGRTATLTADLSGCASVSAGSARWYVLDAAGRALLGRLLGRVLAPTACPGSAVETTPGGGTGSPPATALTLVICPLPTPVMPSGGGSGRTGPAVLTGDRAATVMRRIAASPRSDRDAMCTADLGPSVQVVAVDAAGMTRFSAQSYGCGYIGNGEWTVQNKALGAELVRTVG
jgi:hypothetical protein